MDLILPICELDHEGLGRQRWSLREWTEFTVEFMRPLKEAGEARWSTLAAVMPDFRRQIAATSRESG